MTLREIIRDIERRERTLTLFDPPPGLTRELREHFVAQQVVVESAAAGQAPGGYAVLSEDGTALAAVEIGDLDPPFGAETADVLDELHGYMDHTSFSSYDAEQLRATSREIEDRAWRAATGSIHAGFRTVETMAAEAEVYARLAATDLDVHAYAVPDGRRDGPDLGDATVHLTRSDEVRHTRFVAFDGGRVPTDRCVLLAEPREDDRFVGVWTYDDDTVDAVVRHLERQYLTAN